MVLAWSFLIFFWVSQIKIILFSLSKIISRRKFKKNMDAVPCYRDRVPAWLWEVRRENEPLKKWYFNFGGLFLSQKQRNLGVNMKKFTLVNPYPPPPLLTLSKLISWNPQCDLAYFEDCTHWPCLVMSDERKRNQQVICKNLQLFFYRGDIS